MNHCHIAVPGTVFCYTTQRKKKDNTPTYKHARTNGEAFLFNYTIPAAIMTALPVPHFHSVKTLLCFAVWHSVLQLFNSLPTMAYAHPQLLVPSHYCPSHILTLPSSSICHPSLPLNRTHSLYKHNCLVTDFSCLCCRPLSLPRSCLIWMSKDKERNSKQMSIADRCVLGFV